MKKESVIANRRSASPESRSDSHGPVERRAFLARGVKVAGALAAGGVASTAGAQARAAESIGGQFPHG